MMISFLSLLFCYCEGGGFDGVPSKLARSNLWFDGSYLRDCFVVAHQRHFSQ